MTHDEAILLLSARIDGPLPADQDQALETWISETADNRVLAEAFQTQHADLETTFAERRDAARQTAAAVAKQLPPPSPAPALSGWRKWLAAPLPAGLAAAVLVGLGLFLFRGKSDPGPARIAAVKYDPFGAYGLQPKKRPDAPTATELKVGETLVTKPGEKSRVALPDGSLLYLNQKTEVRLVSDRHVKLDAGEVFLEAVPAKTDADRFRVETPSRSVTALGTKFAVTAEKGATGVHVTQGKVEVSGLTEKLTSGQELAVGADRITPAARASAALDWTRDLMVAAESPLVPAGKYSGGSLVAIDPYGQEAKLRLVKYHIDVHIEDGFARTTIDQTYFNNENQRMEGTFYFPLPPDASLSRLAMYVEGNLMEGGMAEREQARDAYETIRYQQRDPALLEWVDGSVFKMRVFPLEARQEKRIVLSYTQKLPVLYGRATYRFPAGHTLAMVDRWSFHGFVKGGKGFAPVVPSHPDMKMEAQGNDLVLSDAANGVKVDRDVVVELTDSRAAGEQALWSMGELDGQKYLMLRFRPDLPTAPRRERRDWVVLFESSGARDPLVARAQVEVIRSLLSHAEHEDTFSVLTVGTRVRTWKNEPVYATAENVGEAVAWLEKSHLIGATNLDQALSDVGPLLRAGSNPHLVHVGGGIASIGEQRADELVKRIPQGTRYVGIGVGRKFSPAFMKTAAERTGGLFTQVNPDESMSWRGFEIASTLNAPRLLDVKVAAEGTEFLTFANTLAHGEEFAAVANVTKGMPTRVEVRGVLDGQPVERVIPVDMVAAGAGYLPRTWAKLEIDRLMAAGSSDNRKTITDLSKAMYVMTPYTSLLVLENEAMYEQFKVDRGRKDHWAMYPCPPKIPVVYIPDPNSPVGSGVDLQGQKPHENQVIQTILYRQQQRALNGPAADWAGINGRNFSGNVIGLQNPNMSSLDLDIPIRATSFGRSIPADGRRMVLANSDGEMTYSFTTGLGVDALQRDGTWEMAGDRFGVEFQTRLHDRLDKALPELLAADARTGKRRRVNRDGYINGPGDAAGVRFKRTLKEGETNLHMFFDSTGGVPGAAGRGDDFLRLSDPQPELLGRSSFGSERFDVQSLTGERLSDLAPVLYARDMDRDGAEVRKKFSKQLAGVANARQLKLRRGTIHRGLVSANDFADFKKTEDSWAEVNEPVRGFLDPRGTDGMTAVAAMGTAPQYYTRPAYTGNNQFFTDLVSFAPGMSSSAADVRAVLEAEAAPRSGNKRGTIDPAARAIIDAARTAGWSTTILGRGPEAVAFVHDGQGRYAYERRVGLGLIERVVCDGTKLWHLYPELGIGAERVVTRHHRQFLSVLVPDFVPPADDLAVGADVKKIDDNTVALVPLFPATDEPIVAWVEVHLVFAANQLVERRWVLNGTAAMKKEALGLIVREVSGGGPFKTVTTWMKELSKTTAPDIRPDLSKLVVLPLPLRTRDQVYRELELDPNQDLYQNQNACFEYMTPEAQMKLLAGEFASGNGQNVGRIFDACFRQKGETRPGFFTLLSASNTSPRSWGLGVAFERDRTDPLLGYLYWTHDGEAQNWQARYGLAPTDPKATDFLGRLDAFRKIAQRWTSGEITSSDHGQRDAERARVLEFVTANADNALGWAALGLVQDRCPNAGVWKHLADVWGVVAKQSALKYQARYEEARCLGNAGTDAALAQKKYQALFRDALKEGVLPPLDSSFRNVLENGEKGEWAKLMRETASLCAERKARPVIVTLAWQCYQLGDVAMADTLLEAALDRVPREEKGLTYLAAVHFLNATSRHDRADALVRELLTDGELAKDEATAPAKIPAWRLASQVADNRQDRVRAIECLETALNLEYDRLPEVFDVQPIRNDYGRLIGHYEWLADASKSLGVTPPKDLIARVVKAADRWRHLDAEAHQVPNRVAALLRKTGGEGAAELAWDYATTPLAVKPNESEPWVSLAASARQEGDWRLADKCYEMAYAAEPTNAQLLWDRAAYLQQQGQVAESRTLYRQLADKDWQPRFSGLKAQARQVVEGSK